MCRVGCCAAAGHQSGGCQIHGSDKAEDGKGSAHLLELSGYVRPIAVSSGCAVRPCRFLGVVMSRLVGALLRSIEWNELRTSVGTAESVPEAMHGLLAADSDDDAMIWYWQLDNRVVVQGQLYASAICLIPVLLSALLMRLREPARYWLVELAIQIATGESHVSEAERGLGSAALRAFREGLWIVYAQLNDDSARVRASAVDLLAAIDPDPRRLTAIVLEQLREDSSEEVQRAVERIGR